MSAASASLATRIITCAPPLRHAATVSPKALSPQLYQRVATTVSPRRPARELMMLWPERPQEVLGNTAQARWALWTVTARCSMASTPQLSLSDRRKV